MKKTNKKTLSINPQTIRCISIRKNEIIGGATQDPTGTAFCPTATCATFVSCAKGAC